MQVAKRQWRHTHNYNSFMVYFELILNVGMKIVTDDCLLRNPPQSCTCNLNCYELGEFVHIVLRACLSCKAGHRAACSAEVLGQTSTLRTFVL